MTFFTQKFLFIQPNFRMTFLVIYTQLNGTGQTIITAQTTAFHHCTFQVKSSLHILCITARLNKL